MDLQKLLSLTRKCIDNYNLINDDDVICLGVSGGKDSLSMALAFHELLRFYPKKFTIKAVCADLGFNNVDFKSLEAFFSKLNIEFHLIKTDIATIVFDIRKESNPCALCCKLRKGAIDDYANKINCNKVAYAHNKDDLIETGLMSLIYEGRFYTFKPNTYLDRTNLHVIRPMILIDEADIKGFANSYPLPVLKNPCPADGNTKREYVKNLIKQIGKENKGFQKSLFNACISTFK